jgi:hypothetical protein
MAKGYSALPSPADFGPDAAIIAIYNVDKYEIGPMAITLVINGWEWSLLGVSDPNETWEAIEGCPLLAWHHLSNLIP